jgi:hypothetical protein
MTIEQERALPYYVPVRATSYSTSQKNPYLSVSANLPDLVLHQVEEDILLG